MYYVCRRVTMDYVKSGELPILRGEMVLHADTIEELNARVAKYLGFWKWKPDQSIYGGYWVNTDPTLSAMKDTDREGECYIIAKANVDEEKMIAAAFSWHSGGGSPLYQFASTGCIFGEEHRSRLCTELARCFGDPLNSDSDQHVLSMLDTHIRDRVATCTLPMTIDT